MSFRSCETLRDACWGSLCSSGNEMGNDHFICLATNAVLVPDMSNVSNDIASVEDSELCLNWQGLVSLDWAVFCIMFWPALARVSSASSKFKYKNKKIQKVVSLRHVLTYVSLVHVSPASCYVPTTFAAASVRLTMNWGLWNTVERPGDVACTSYALLCLAKIWHPAGFDQGIMTPFIELCTEWCQDDVDWNRRCIFCLDYLELVNCPTRWSLYCPLGICIDHIYWNIFEIYFAT